MNCLEFRRMLAVEPAGTDPRFLAHREECGRCAEAHAAAQAFERARERALQVPVPEGIADQVLLRQLTAARHERPRARYAAWRLAAGFVLALGAGLFGYLGWQAGRPLPELAIAHLAHEPHALAARADIPRARIEAAFREAGAALPGQPLRVDYLANCVVDGRRTVHMVVQRPEGPVTVMYLAEARDGDAASFAREGLRGRAVPMREGTLVLIASEDRSFDALEAEWRRALGGAVEIAHAAR